MTTGNVATMPSYKKTLLQAAAYKRVRSAANGVLRAFDINTTQWLMLGILNDHTAGLKITDIARSLEVEVPLITRLTKSLGHSGLIRRSTSATDRRVRPVSLTVRGKKVVDDVEHKMERQMTEIEQAVNSAEALSYFQTLELLTLKRKPRLY